MRLDDLDRSILARLQQDGRVSYVSLSTELGVSEGTIRKRVRRLEDDGVVQITGITNPLEVGLDTVAFVWFEVDRRKLDKIMNELRSLDAVRYLLVTTGSYDLVAKVVLSSREELVNLLNDSFSNIDGIISTATSIVLQIHKEVYDWEPFANDATQSPS